jgi:hypothetical protein
MPSVEYRRLKKHVANLERALLPPATVLADPSTNLSTIGGLDYRTAGFLVLCHAEFETYLEDRSRNIAELARTRWLSQKRKSLTLTTISLVAYYGKGNIPSAVPKVSHKDFATSDITPLIRDATDEHLSHVNSNNGIKEKDVVRLLLPIGLRISQMSAFAIAELNAYGAVRGKIAHRSHSIRAALNARDERDRAQRVLNELLAIDTALSHLT